ncbi:NAD(P)H-dependent oxidoreductase subunit E [Nannocystis sp.]|uniref:NAD(P)H-dependent oxidoreductase subunit E n=1 Tax=Nannocystis sp. TaxID=1962667 RepID=UPI0025E871B0|nr:NAD(P)H-dependent oxidoreductase subunit E [Nannocystis sp.]
MRYRPPSILSQLTALQAELGWLSQDSLTELAHRLGVPLHRVEGVASFYPHFRREPPPAHRVELCRDLSCTMAGGAEALRAAARAHEAATGERVEVAEVSCLGRCDRAPAALVHHDPVTTPAELRACLAHAHTAADPADMSRKPYRIDPYASPGDRYAAARAIGAIGAGDAAAAEHAIAELRAAGLRGMGGAGFPTAIKWSTVRATVADEKFVVCNADESEPGTFKDRELLAALPHLVWEGMLLGALVVGATRAILYIRHEYELERRAMAAEQTVAAAVARELGVELEIFVSPGGYIMGEETALLEALEDRRGEPRNKPPFPGVVGLFGRPTLINNVETLAAATAILARPDGSAWWKAQGLRGCGGLKFISISGDVARPGVFEVATGTTVAELVALAGGVVDGRPIAAILPGGASSAFLPPAAVDTPLDFEAMRRAGSTLGSGAVVIVAEGRDLLALGLSLTRFFRNESCGKCVPCRVGSQKAVLLLEQVLAGDAGPNVPELLRALDQTMAQTSICGLGQVALTPAISVLDHFPAALAAHPPRRPSLRDRA